MFLRVSIIGQGDVYYTEEKKTGLQLLPCSLVFNSQRFLLLLQYFCLYRLQLQTSKQPALIRSDFVKKKEIDIARLQTPSHYFNLTLSAQQPLFPCSNKQKDALSPSQHLDFFSFQVMLASLSVSQRCSTTCPSLTRLQRIRCKGRGHIICVVTVCCWVACIGPHPPWGLISSVYQQRPMSPSGLPHSHTLQKGIGCSHIFASWEEKSALLLACCKT